MNTSLLQPIVALPITPEIFHPFGQVIFATEDGNVYNSRDAQLQLEGTPRFYIMRLHQRGRRFHRITRHLRCTQCLGALEGKEWLIGVAPAAQTNQPDWQAITVFRIPGTCFIKLNAGTWHAGPYFDHTSIDFYNLELRDTNIVDHETCDLLADFGVEFEIVDPQI